MTTEPVIIDKSEERSLINLVSPKCAKAIEKLYNEFPEYLEDSEDTLFVKLNPTEMCQILRLQFWEEYNRAQANECQMNMANIYKGHMTRETFNFYYLEKPKNLAWIICPMTSHLLSLKAALDRGKASVAKILTMNLFGPNGKIDPQAAKVFLQTYQMVENRVMGSAIQRIAQQTHLELTNKVAEDTQSSVEKLQEKLEKEVEALED